MVLVPMAAMVDTPLPRTLIPLPRMEITDSIPIHPFRMPTLARLTNKRVMCHRIPVHRQLLIAPKMGVLVLVLTLGLL